jgi:hypothetical protein
MIDEFETFLSFDDEELARFAAETLKGNNVEFIIGKSKPLLDRTLVDNSTDQNIHIKVRRQDFEKANCALEEYYKTQITTVDPEYFLLSFSDEELTDVISKPDEWGHFNYQLAQKLLEERGHGVEKTALLKLKEERIKDLAQPEKANWLLLLFGYFFIPFGVIVGFLIGRHLYYSKRPLPNGQLIFAYRERDRKHGHRIMVIAVGMLILSLVLWIIAGMIGN